VVQIRRTRWLVHQRRQVDLRMNEHSWIYSKIHYDSIYTNTHTKAKTIHSPPPTLITSSMDPRTSFPWN
jgi:hypothetical protein